jgi:hypothetical protein
MKNLKAAAIAWELVMEHNQVYRALTSVVHNKNDEDYNTEKVRAFRFVYGIIMRVIDQPEGAKQFGLWGEKDANVAFLSRLLDEIVPEEWVRKVINPYKYPAKPGS